MLDLELGAEAVELMVPRCSALAEAEQSIRELFAIVSEDPRDRHRGGTIEVAQEMARVGRRFRRLEADKDPARGAVDRHEQIPASLLVGYLWQVFDAHMQIAGLVGLEGLVRGPQRFRLQVLQPRHTMPSQTAIEPRARDVRVQELAHHSEKVVKRQQQGPAQRDSDSLLRRRQRRLQPVCGMAAVVHAVPLAPFPDGLFGDAVALRHLPGGLRARLDRGPDLQRRRRLLVKRDQPARPPSRTSRRIDLAMKRA